MSRLSETFQLGSLTISALSDGAPDRALGGFFHGIEPAEWMRALGITSPDSPVPFNFGSFLVRGDGHTTLIDTGNGVRGKTMGVPGGGELLRRIAELGVRREDVDRVLHTHLHGDHCGWDIDDELDGAVTFPSAQVFVHEKELEYWTGAASDGNQQAAYTRTRVLPLRVADRIRTFAGEFAVSDIATMVPTPGHTPGHCSVMLISQGQHLLIIVGDAAHHPVHFEHHDWIPGVDLDPAESQRSRAKLAALAADTGALVTGGHFPILTLGRVRRVDMGYRFESV
ncbi:MAG: MBL fold metallo-hydrolase [Dehalococcoidia bacterium]|nr:MAG: MBL fold metallo-hydrolase [Dehalococcoidia bacterium]